MCKMNKKKRKLKRMRKKQKDNYDVDMLNNRIDLMGTSPSYMEEMLGPTKNAAKVVESLNKVLKHKLALTNGAKKELRHE